MMRIPKTTLLGIAVVVAAFGANDARAEELKVGDKAPSFEMVGSDGKTYKSADLNGKQAYVIAWFPKAFTGG
jgi:peroxiredoxin Q/BCP